MVTTTKAPSSATAPVKAAPKKAAPDTPVVAKKVAAPVAKAPAAVKTTFAPMAPVAAPAAAPLAADAPAKKPAAKKTSATKTVLKPSTAPKPVFSTEQRNHYVAVAAFYIAERRGFTLGNPMEDWIAAEAEVDRLIASGHFFS